MTVKALSSEVKVISSRGKTYELRQEAQKFVNDALIKQIARIPVTAEVSIRVTVELVVDAPRVGSKTQREILKTMIADGNGNAWYNAKGKYLFEFHSDKFMWGNRDLYLTAGEKLALYKRLIRDEAMDRMTISRLRKKFGKDFLEGFV